jgi:hypothetical protein
MLAYRHMYIYLTSSMLAWLYKVLLDAFHIQACSHTYTRTSISYTSMLTYIHTYIHLTSSMLAWLYKVLLGAFSERIRVAVEVAIASTLAFRINSETKTAPADSDLTM